MTRNNRDEFIRLRNDYDPEKNIIIKYSKDFFTMIENLLLKDKLMVTMISLTFTLYILIAIIILIYK